MTKPGSYCHRVLIALDDIDEPIKARDLASRVGLTYMQTVFALNALNNNELVTRIGSKSTSMWVKRRYLVPGNPIIALEIAFKGFFK